MRTPLLLLVFLAAFAHSQTAAIGALVADPFRPPDTLGILTLSPNHRTAGWLSFGLAVPIVDLSFPESLRVASVNSEIGGAVYGPWGAFFLSAAADIESFTWRYALGSGSSRVQGTALFRNELDRATVAWASPELIPGLRCNLSCTPGIRSENLYADSLGNHLMLGMGAAVLFGHAGWDVRLGTQRSYRDNRYAAAFDEFDVGGMGLIDTIGANVVTNCRLVTALQQSTLVLRSPTGTGMGFGITIDRTDCRTVYSYSLEDKASVNASGWSGRGSFTFGLLHRPAVIELFGRRNTGSLDSRYRRSNGSYSTSIENAGFLDRTLGMELRRDLIGGRRWSVNAFTGVRNETVTIPGFDADPAKYAVVSYGFYFVNGEARALSYTAGLEHRYRSDRWECTNRLAYLGHSLRGSFDALNVWSSDFWSGVESRIMHALALGSSESLRLGPWSISGTLRQTIPLAIIDPGAQPSGGGGGGAATPGTRHVRFGLFDAGVRVGYSR